MDSTQGFFCHLPFVAVETDGQHAAPCCVFKGSIPLQGYQQNPRLKSVKRQLWHNQAPAECQHCVDSEKHTGKSFRVLANTFHPDLSDQVRQHDESYSDLGMVYVHGSNVCNLKCLPCQSSSFIRSQEMYKLGLLEAPPGLAQIKNPEAIADLDMHTLTLCSGEPLYDKGSRQILDSLVQRGKSQSIRLDINTNLTNIDHTILDFLEDNFNSVMIKASIDGVGAANDYLRYPSHWNQIEQAVDLILQRKKMSIVVTTALSNLALLRYHELVQWCLSKGIKDLFISQVFSPEVLSCTDFFYQHAAYCRDQLADLASLPNITNRTLYALDLCQDLCNNVLQSGESDGHTALAHYLDTHDRERSTEWRAVWPELTIS